MHRKIHGLLLAVIGAVACLAIAGSAAAQAGITTITGTLPHSVATYVIEVPANWNGTLFLYSHGYVQPGNDNPAADVGDPATRAFMLASGFALAGSSYEGTGWAVHEALPDQIAVLDVFKQMFRKPARTIAWGHSLGGMITAGLIQRYPERFDAALPMCGVLSGGVATWNTALDAAFAFKTLVASGSGLQVVNIADPPGNLAIAEEANSAAQATPQGRAQTALVAALGDTPGWFDPSSPEPAATDFSAQQANQFLWAKNVDFPFAFALRAELEARAGGNVSWNTDVDYVKQFERSADADEVRALYAAAGLDLDKDLERLNEAPRISADPEAVEYLERNIIYNGEIHIPVLTLHTTGDGLVVVENESAYKDVVQDEGHERFLRRAFVSRAGHCTFTPAETIAAVQVVLDRLDTGSWHGVNSTALNSGAAALGPMFNIPVPSAFVDFKPAQYLRPFDAETEECRFGFLCEDEFASFDRH